MVTCEVFVGRLYDEDCRRALGGRGAVPRDVAAHLQSCLECPARWAAAVDDTRVLPSALVETAPPVLERRMRLDLAGVYKRRSRMRWRAAVMDLAWPALLGALVIHAATQSLPSSLLIVERTLLSLVGGSIVFAAGAVYQAVGRTRHA